MKTAAFRHNRVLQALIAWLLALWVLTAIDPFDRRDWLLENILVFVYALVLVVTYRRFAFSNPSYALFTIFMSLHLVGAHYTYSETPVGFWMQSALDLERNPYDRCVHFAFGLLLAPAFREVLVRAAGVCVSWSWLLAVVAIIAFGSVYEVLEGIAAVVVEPELGVAFLGTQGDEWDAQKDTGVALLGAVLSMLFMRARMARRR